MRIQRADRNKLAEVVALLQKGGVIIYPTETVYGLGCLASRAEAIERIAALKGSPETASYLILIRSADEMGRYASQIPQAARKLAKKFWPGPLTLILPAKADLHPRLIGPTGGVGMRVSSHPWCRALLEVLDEALISTSANFTGYPPPASLLEIDQRLADEVDLVVDGGTLAGTESTVVDVCGEAPVIKRLGAVAAAKIPAIIEDLDTTTIANRNGARKAQKSSRE